MPDGAARATRPFVRVGWGIPRLGSLWMLVAGLLFASMGVFVKFGGRSFSAPELVFYRSLFGLAAVYAMARARRLPVASPLWRVHVGRSLAGFAGMMLFFYVVGLLPLATATTLNYTSPLFLVVLTVAVLRERPRPVLVGTVALGFAGVVLLLHPTFQSNQAVAGALGLASGLCAAAAYLTTRQLGRAGEPSWRIVLYFALVSTVGAGLAVLAGGGFHRISADGLLVLLGLGATGTLGQLAMTRAYREGDTLTVGSLGYSTVLFTALLSIALWGEVVPASSWLAMGLIGASGILATRATALPPQRVGAAD